MGRIFYPDPHPETSSVDGWANHWITAYTFAVIRGNTGQLAGPNDASNYGINLTSTTASTKFNNMARSIFLFDTSAIPADATITAATFGVYIASKLNDLAMTEAHAALALVGATPATNTALVAADFNLDYWTMTAYATDIPYTSVNTSAFNTMSLNAAGLTLLNASAKGAGGMAKLGLTFGVDRLNETPNWVSSKTSRYEIYYADSANDPYLDITVAYTETMAVKDKVSVVGAIVSADVNTAAINDKVAVAATNVYATPITAAVNDKVTVAAANVYATPITAELNDKVSVVAVDEYTPAAGNDYEDPLAVNDKVAVAATNIRANPLTADVKDKVSVVAANVWSHSETAAINDKVSVVAANVRAQSLPCAISDKVSVVAAFILNCPLPCAINDKVAVVATNVRTNPLS